MAESRSKLPYIFLSITLVLSGIVAVILAMRHRHEETPREMIAPKVPAVDLKPKVPVPTLNERQPGGDPATKPGDLGLGPIAADPAALVARIGKALEAGDLDTAAKLIGKEALDERTAERLKALVGTSGFKLRQPPVREVGELERNELIRWALELDGADLGRDRIYLDLRRKDGKWLVEKLALPPGKEEAVPKAVLVDSLGIADAFLQAALHQNFQLAKEFVDSSTVSDAKIAGLCILFEEGNYKLRAEKPLRALMNKPGAAGYLANVETADGSQAAQFSLMLGQSTPTASWRVGEVNLDQLLDDYAKRFAGGDVYYTPLVKNPQGGDTLVLYFEFDQDQLGERTRRQLEIVAQILRTDPGKKLTISGHTDALGSKGYNNVLSEKRADVVRDFLATKGVSRQQIVTVAKGMTQPRRPNFTESGEDNPDGRRANRRTEIYLDF
ncbi:OmpA family protein [Luteolibacter ambystomatis]|uniref:OmpA family protein n=1 Tax=Luteolibacter ambystomatis TaxID=2824561 RepID=A0A975IZW2_9BACT|nr:OmpA family protein [Luteolibacter ambystomatis]QUE50460.1 OmpA family protein [Luteolibacter ambystomatis]